MPSFRCQPSAENEAFTPTIADLYFNHEYLAFIRTRNLLPLNTTDDTVASVFRTPAESAQRNCSGMATSVEFCYEMSESELGRNLIVLDFLVLSQNSGGKFSIDQRTRVRSRPTANRCSVLTTVSVMPPPPTLQQQATPTSTTSQPATEQICCRRERLRASQRFAVPKSTFAFAILAVNAKLLTIPFTDANAEYYTAEIANSGAINSTFEARPITKLASRMFPLLRLIVEADESSSALEPISTETQDDSVFTELSNETSFNGK